MQMDLSKKKIEITFNFWHNRGKQRVAKKIWRCLEWNQKQNKYNKKWWVWLWKRLHKN